VVDAAVDVVADAGSGSGSGSDAGSGTDAGTTDAGSGSDTCTSVSVSASATLGVDFNVGVRDQYLGTFGPVRRHSIWARGSATGSGTLTLAGSLTATANGWTATISVSGDANATAYIHADQELCGRWCQWFAIGDATLSGSASFADSVTFTQTCNPPGVVATTPGTPAIGVNVTIDDLRFYGYFFPRLQGPLVTRVRGAIAQFARNFLNRQLAALIQQAVFTANQAYAAKKAEVLAALIAKLPAGCGCAVRN
jgi:hypothetical protein